MFNGIIFRFTVTLIMIAALTIAIYKAGSTQASTTTGMVSAIVELRNDPAAVYKAKSQRTGRTISDNAIQAYRDQLKAGQDQFLKDARERQREHPAPERNYSGQQRKSRCHNRISLYARL